ncbi:MAG: DUF2933 domain-containing protein [Alphaproteobacteria bacterium]|nr:DUF2933 domain-containing protein [Alphaproteobacteria bacterium]
MTSNDIRYFLGTKLGLALTLLMAAIGAYLFWTHTGHIVSALPYLFLLLCPLMHLFGHRHGQPHKEEHRHESK